MLDVFSNSDTLISIVLPTYNRCDYLERAISSVLNQTMKAWELIIVDDGSTDRSFQLLESYVDTYPHIRLVRHSHRGHPYSLNVGILNAATSLVTFLDSDDEYLPEHLELRLAFLEKNPEIELIHGGLVVVGDPFVIDYYDESKTIDVRECFCGSTILGKREVFLSLKGFRNIKHSDTDFMLRAQKQFSIKRYDSASYRYYRDTPQSMTNTLLRNQHKK